MKKILYSIMAVVLVCSFHFNVYAAVNEEIEVIDGSALLDGEQAEVIYTNPARGNILNSVIGRITNNGDGSVNVYGSVYGSTTCDKIVLDMTLQKLVNGSWKNVTSFSDTTNNKTHLIKSYNVTVAKGYYYRIKLAGIVTKNGVSESQVSTTDGIMIK